MAELAPAAVVERRTDLTPAQAAALARLTRLAYAGSDPLPGLPEPDGQFETPAALLDAVWGAGSVYLVIEADRSVALLRVRPAPGCWRVSRIAALPGLRHRGLVRLLLDTVARDAREQGVDWLELDAVVERCLPPLYSRLGFQVRSNWPSPDKPLSELTLRRSTAEPAGPVPLGWHQARLSRHSSIVAWFLSGRTLLRAGQPASGDPLADVLAVAGALHHPDLRLAGVDLSRHPAEVPRTFAGVGRSHPEHLMPRRRRSETLALWRPVPGGEIPFDELAGGRQ